MLKTSSLSDLAIRRVSAPNISGTSVNIVVPPWATRKSENFPTRGFAVIPESPSDPPHFRPILSSDKLQVSRVSPLIISYSSTSNLAPSSISSETS